jgi:diguanylate cyclase
MKSWMKKLLDQFQSDSGAEQSEIGEDRASLLYIIDTLNKHLIETERHPARRVRESLDGFAKELLSLGTASAEETLFRFRQWYSSYRLDEYTYIQNTFEDFKTIVWDFADQLSEEIKEDQTQDAQLKSNLNHLREAVETNSIEILKSRSRDFINFYIETQSRKDERKIRRLKTVRNHLSTVKKQLNEANQTIQLDHLTKAFNRRSFDAQVKKQASLAAISGSPMTLIILDIDFFKKINDCYGHDIGDFILIECVSLLKKAFGRPEDFVARIGGEEFAIVLPNTKIDHAIKFAEAAMSSIRNEKFVHGKLEITFTASMGIAQLNQNESTDQWIKRADTALYYSKNNGRNRFTLAPDAVRSDQVA